MSRVPSASRHSPWTARSPESTSRLRSTPIPAMAVFARAPVAGHAKTRLIPLLGAQGAARLQAALISDTLRKVARLRRWFQPYLFLAASPIPFGRSPAEANLYEQPLARAVISEFSVIHQQGRDLGERLENAFHGLLRFHPSCVVIGTDSPLFPRAFCARLLGSCTHASRCWAPAPMAGII